MRGCGAAPAPRSSPAQAGVQGRRCHPRG
jgi:hypothetical protein